MRGLHCSKGFQQVSFFPSADLGPPAGPACPDSWVGYRGKCYHFSEDEGNWTYSQTHCSALNTSLAEIDSQQDMVRDVGRFEHWIGLRRDPGQPWKWTNGTEFNNCFSPSLNSLGFGSLMSEILSYLSLALY
uniref:C-type lectin domain-containing protein n=1 Tax=Pelusios castaneus TaxID=367368 RepID=A0A8C8SU68_9SAUR